MAHFLDHVGEEHYHLWQRLGPAPEPADEVADGQEDQDPAGRFRVVVGQPDGIQVRFCRVV